MVIISVCLSDGLVLIVLSVNKCNNIPVMMCAGGQKIIPAGSRAAAFPHPLRDLTTSYL
jgi:hypothetical protein